MSTLSAVKFVVAKICVARFAISMSQYKINVDFALKYEVKFIVKFDSRCIVTFDIISNCEQELYAFVFWAMIASSYCEKQPDYRVSAMVYCWWEGGLSLQEEWNDQVFEEYDLVDVHFTGCVFAFSMIELFRSFKWLLA